MRAPSPSPGLRHRLPRACRSLCAVAVTLQLAGCWPLAVSEEERLKQERVLVQAQEARIAALLSPFGPGLGSLTDPCKASGLPKAPWPPPQPTNTSRVHRGYLLPSGGGAPTTMGAFLDHMRERIRSAGYVVPPVLGAGCFGFAMVLQMERLEADGQRVSGRDGFVGPGQRTSFDLGAILRQLFLARPGFYRVILLVVTDERAGRFAAQQTAEGYIRELGRLGKDELPGSMASRNLGDTYEVHALIYEFERKSGAEADGVSQVVPPAGRLPALVHLELAGLIRR